MQSDTLINEHKKRKVDNIARVCNPTNIRERLNIKPSDELSLFYSENGGVYFRKAVKKNAGENTK